MSLASGYLNRKVSHLREQLGSARGPRECLPLLNEISLYLWRIDPVEAGKHSRRLIRIAGAIQDAHWVARGYLRYACSLEARSQFAHAGRYFTKAWRLLESEPDNLVEKSFACRRLAENLSETGDTEGAARFHELALEHARQSNDRREIAASMRASGEFYRELGLYSEALERVEEALRMFEDIAPSDELALIGVALVRFSLGEIYESLDDHACAAYHYAEGLKLVRLMGDKIGEVAACRGMGSIAAKQNRYDDAFGWYGRTAALAEELGDIDQQAQAFAEIGSLHTLRRDYSQALKYLDRAAERFAAIGSEPGNVCVLIAKGEIMMARRRWKSAKVLLSRAACFPDNTKPRMLRSRVHTLLARTCEGMGDVAEALQHYRHVGRLEQEIAGNEVRRRLTEFEIRTRIRTIEEQKSTCLDRAKQLEQEVEHRSREVAAASLHLAQTNGLLNDLRKRILTFGRANGHDLEVGGSVERSIDMNEDTVLSWAIFEEKVGRLDQGFLQNLTTRCSGLTPTEIRVCSLLRISLSNKEIGGLLNMSHRTVDTHRTRIRRKLGLRKEDNLIAVLTML